MNIKQEDMEYACFIKQKKDIASLDSKFTRVYYGEELCENKFPNNKMILEAFKQCKLEGFDFTLVTCIFTNTKLREFKELLESLLSLNENIEIVVNDVGLFHYCLKKNLRNIKLIIGRLLNKAAKTPRYQNIEGQLNTYQKEALSYSFFMNRISSKFFSEGDNLFAYEMDNVIQLNIPEEYNLNIHLVMPYVLVTVTRNCLFNGIEDNDGLTRKRKACHQECNRYNVMMEHATLIDPLECISAGIFYKNYIINDSIASKIKRLIINEDKYNLER